MTEVKKAEPTTAMTVAKLVKSMDKVSDVDPADRDAFIHFYTGGQPERMYVPMLDFLRWKRIKIKDKNNDNGAAAKEWTLAYRSLAVELYDSEEILIKKSANDFLLFDVDFLISMYDEAKAILFEKFFGG